eukprot:scaffold153904_cov28-Tisochrysis_lutea.AAC.1
MLLQPTTTTNRRRGCWSENKDIRASSKWFWRLSGLWPFLTFDDLFTLGVSLCDSELNNVDDESGADHNAQLG